MINQCKTPGHIFLPIFIICLFAILVIYPVPLRAWDMTGHRLSAEIAYQTLTPCARAVLSRQTTLLRSRYPFVRVHGDLAAWPDHIKSRGLTIYNEWHYISSPWDETGRSPTFRVKEANALWALTRIEKMFQVGRLTADEQAFFFSFYWHILADIHQPLHTLTRIDAHFPNGDLGGLRYRIDSGLAKNLHELWDRGVDQYGYPHLDYPLRKQQVIKVATKLQAKYPRQMFTGQLQAVNYSAWVEESQKLAKELAYATPYAARPTSGYLARASEVAQKQITLSGYRMALAFGYLFAQEIAQACAIAEVQPGRQAGTGEQTQAKAQAKAQTQSQAQAKDFLMRVVRPYLRKTFE